MKFAYFDASTGLSGDMILAALLDLGVSEELFQKKMAELKLPIKIQISETKRAGLRALKVNVRVDKKKTTPRKLKDIENLIHRSPLSSPVREKAVEIFSNLLRAESRVHGTPYEETHLHEAGADDALIDVLGCCFLLEELRITDIYSSPLNIGAGTVKSSHGLFPVPPPAVAELLRNIPVYSAHVEEELVTPTGAAIISTLAKDFILFPEIVYEKVGCGAGKKNFPLIPNILRVFYGERKDYRPEKKVFTLETNIDDSSPQILSHYMEKALRLGALDVFLTPVMMKKNRMATKLTILAEAGRMEYLISSLFKETSTIGVRYYPVERRVLQRAIKKVKVLGEEIAIKVSYHQGREVNIQPEFSDCQKLAKKKELSLKEVTQLALNEYFRNKKGHTNGS
ncbi:MAG: nickel pincer cofactor biosynthesis protein LarC [Candidatus Aminicenantales bacterium]